MLELRRRRSRFSGPPALLDALETTAVLRRHRSRPLGREVELTLAAEPDSTAPDPDRRDPPRSTPDHADPAPQDAPTSRRDTASR